MKKKIKLILKPKYLLYLNKKHLLKIYLRKLRNKKLLKENFKKGYFPVEIISSMGLFANLTYALYIIKYCEEKKLTPLFKFTIENSNIKGNPFDYFFKINSKIELPTKTRYAKMKAWSDLNLNVDWTKHQSLNIESADILIKNHLIIKNNVLELVDSFFNENMKNKKPLGLHYRATDKFSETKIISYEFIIKNLEYYIDKYPETELVFVSTDDRNFIPFLENNFSKRPIYYHQDSFRSNSKTSIHLSGQDLYKINLDAIVNCLLLSKCTSLMKTASNLSAWSKLFNPNLQVIILSKPKEKFNFFPEKHVAENVLYEPIS